MEETLVSVPISFLMMVFLPSCGKCSTPPVTLRPFVHGAAVRGASGATLRTLADFGGTPLQPGWRSLDSETIGFRTDDTIEAVAMKTLMTFCGYHPLEMVMHPLGLFPAEKRDNPMWCNRVSHVKDVWAMYPDLVGRITV